MTLQQYRQSYCDEYKDYGSSNVEQEFQKYWFDFHPNLAIACVLDPRHKLQIVDYNNRNIYENDSLEFMQVKSKMYSERSKKCSPPPLADKSPRKDNYQAEPIGEIFRLCEFFFFLIYNSLPLSYIYHFFYETCHNFLLLFNVGI